MNIFVGNLAFQTSEQQLRSLFSPFGEITSISIATDRITRRSRGFGFVEMPDNAHAEKAIAQLNTTRVDERSIVVNEAKPRTENGSSRTGNRW